MGHLMNWCKHNLVLLISSVATIAMAVATLLQAKHTAFEWVATLLPLGLGALAHFVTVPWARLRPLVAQAAQVTAQVAPAKSAWPLLIQSAVDSAAAQAMATGFPAPISSPIPGPNTSPAPALATNGSEQSPKA
jgi:hypothetical protein